MDSFVIELGNKLPLMTTDGGGGEGVEHASRQEEEEPPPSPSSSLPSLDDERSEVQPHNADDRDILIASSEPRSDNNDNSNNEQTHTTTTATKREEIQAAIQANCMAMRSFGSVVAAAIGKSISRHITLALKSEDIRTRVSAFLGAYLTPHLFLLSPSTLHCTPTAIVLHRFFDPWAVVRIAALAPIVCLGAALKLQDEDARHSLPCCCGGGQDGQCSDWKGWIVRKWRLSWALARLMAMPALFLFVLNAMPSSGDAYGNFV